MAIVIRRSPCGSHVTRAPCNGPDIQTVVKSLPNCRAGNGSRGAGLETLTASPEHRCWKNMDSTELRELADDTSPMMKTIRAATSGLVAGTVWGTIVASWYDVPRVERSVALPGLIRTAKLMGNYGLMFAAVSGVYIGMEQMVEKYRMKKDFINGTVGGFVAGASVLGFRGRSISTAISAGAALAFTSAVIDIGGQTTRVDNGKEYLPYTTEKRPSTTHQ